MSRVSSSASRVWTTTGRRSLARQRELRGEGRALLVGRRVIVVIVEAALADRDGAACSISLMPSRSRAASNAGCVVGMHAGGVKAEAGMSLGDRRARAAASSDSPMHTIADAHRLPRPFDDGLAIGVERRIGEMDVAIDEFHHTSTNRRAARRFMSR